MKQNLFFAVAPLVLVLGLAGCTQANDHSEQGRPSGTLPPVSPTVSISPPPPPIEPQPTSSYVRDVKWTDCKGVYSASFYPNGTVPAQNNPNWNGRELPFSGVVLNLLDCNRVSWGRFERPVRMIVEHHGYFTPPPGCRPPADTPYVVGYGMIASVWVNDTELATYLEAEYDLPVHLAIIDVHQGSIQEEVWSWSAPGQPTSELQTPVDPLPERKGSYWDARWFWFNGTAVSLIDIHSNYDGQLWTDDTFQSDVGSRLTQGTLQPPMLGSVFPTYAAPGEWRQGIQWAGKVTKFTDHFCSQEIP